MKIIVTYAILIFLIVNLNSHSGNIQPMILSNNSSGSYECDFLTTRHDIRLFPELSYFNEFDTLKYKDKPLGFIIDDLFNKYQLLESETFTNWETFKPEDEFERTHFKFQFKKDDTTSIEINGCITNSKEMIYETNDSIALKHILTIKSFVLEALLLDVKERYYHLKISSMQDSSAIIKPAIIRQRMQYYEQHFPEACK